MKGKQLPPVTLTPYFVVYQYTTMSAVRHNVYVTGRGWDFRLFHGCKIPYISITDSNEYDEFIKNYPRKIDGIKYKTKGSKVVIDIINDDMLFLQVSKKKQVVFNKLPTSLKMLVADRNNIVTLPDLGENLTFINFSVNKITEIPYFPDNLICCDFTENNICEIPQMPKSLRDCYFGHNNIKYLSSENVKHIIDENKRSKNAGSVAVFVFNENPVSDGYFLICEMFKDLGYY